MLEIISLGSAFVYKFMYFMVLLPVTGNRLYAYFAIVAFAAAHLDFMSFGLCCVWFVCPYVHLLMNFSMHHWRCRYHITCVCPRTARPVCKKRTDSLQIIITVLLVAKLFLLFQPFSDTLLPPTTKTNNACDY